MVAILRMGKKSGRFFTAGDVLIDGAVVHLVRIIEAFGMAAGVVGEVQHVLVKAGCAALQNLVRFIATAHKVPAAWWASGVVFAILI